MSEHHARHRASSVLVGLLAALFVWVLCGSTPVAAAPASSPALSSAPQPSTRVQHRISADDPNPVPDAGLTAEVLLQDVLSGGSTTGTAAGAAGNDNGNGNGSDASINLDLPNTTKDSSNSVVIILLLTVLSVAPSLLVLCTSFTRIVIVLSLTRNALGIPQIPPQQVIVGLSVFLTLFVMGPTLSQMKTEALDPLLDGKISTAQALTKAEAPLRVFLLKHTREDELGLFLDASKTETPVARDKVPLNALVPAFVLSELKSSFIIGFVIFVPFLIIDLVVSAVLMGLGMMVLPPSFVSLPFKLLLFVMLDGWMLIVGMLLTSYR